MKNKIYFIPIFIIIYFILASLNLHAQDPGVDFDLNSYINNRLDLGETTIVVPPGRYRVKEASNTHLLFQNRHNVTIIADGVEMICTETVQAIKIIDCNNFKLQGLKVDYDPLPFTQGEIIAISTDKRTLTVDFIDGYSSTVIGDRIEIYDPITGELSAKTYYGATFVVDNIARRVTITKGLPNSSYIEEVGDIVVMDSRGTKNIPHAITPQRCNNLTLENVTLYSGTSFGFFETECNGSKYINCSVDRRPMETEVRARAIKRMRSNNVDAFHSKYAQIGPSYVGCIARYQGDDCFAINGHFHVITETNGNVLTVVGKGGNTPDLYVGDTVELVTYSGERVPDAKINQVQIGRALNAQELNFLQTQPFNGAANNTETASNVYYITIDRPVDLPLGSLINSATRVGNHFEVRNCIAGPNRSRGILVKSSHGIISGNTCVGNWGIAIQCSPEYNWLEAGSGSDIEISNNTINNCLSTAIGVFSKGGNGNIPIAGAHDDIRIFDNVVTNSPNPKIYISSTSNLGFDTENYSASEIELVNVTFKTLSNANNQNLKMKTHIYPIPTDGILNIDLQDTFKNAKVQIIDLSGRKLMDKPLKTNKSILDLSILSKGIYMLYLKDNETLIDVQKIVME